MTVQAKWDRIYRDRPHDPPQAVTVLREFVHLLPAAGSALDLACGLGGNALLLARHGLETWAWDISPAAIERVYATARSLGLTVHAEVIDAESADLQAGRFDVIVVSRFLLRSLTETLMMALKPGGLLFYQTFIRDKATPTGPSNPDFRLATNELLALFSPLRILYYREEGTVGDVTQGLRNEALLIGQRVRGLECPQTITTPIER